MTREDDNPSEGVPVFLERLARSLSDPSASIANGEWHPANAAARKLWACVEAMRDIEDVLAAEKEADTRQLKRLITPLESLRTAIVALGNYLTTSSEMKKQLAADVRKGLGKSIDDLKATEAFGRPADLRLIRDRLSAHVDKDIESWEAQDALSHLQPAQVRDAIEACLDTLVRLLSVNVYAWTASDCPDGFVKLMAVEPSLVTLKMEDGKPVAVVALELASSPRGWVESYCRQLRKQAESLCIK